MFLFCISLLVPRLFSDFVFFRIRVLLLEGRERNESKSGREQGRKGGRETGSNGAREQRSKGAREQKRKSEGSKGAMELGSQGANAEL